MLPCAQKYTQKMVDGIFIVIMGTLLVVAFLMSTLLSAGGAVKNTKVQGALVKFWKVDPPQNQPQQRPQQLPPYATNVPDEKRNRNANNQGPSPTTRPPPPSYDEASAGPPTRPPPPIPDKKPRPSAFAPQPQENDYEDTAPSAPPEDWETNPEGGLVPRDANALPGWGAAQMRYQAPGKQALMNMAVWGYSPHVP